MRQLQKSNPSLLLTANELRVAERDARYIPAVASALTSIICKSTAPNKDVIDTIRQWKISNVASRLPAQSSQSSTSSQSSSNDCKEDEIEALIESRLRSVLAKPSPNKRGGQSQKGNATDDEDNGTQQSTSNQSFDDLLELSSKGAELDLPGGENSSDSASCDEEPSEGQAETGVPHKDGGDELSDYDDWL